MYTVRQLVVRTQCGVLKLGGKLWVFPRFEVSLRFSLRKGENCGFSSGLGELVVFFL